MTGITIVEMLVMIAEVIKMIGAMIIGIIAKVVMMIIARISG